MDGLRLLVITDNVQTAAAWAANNRAPWGSWRLVLVPDQLADAPEGAPFVQVSINGDTFARFAEMIKTRKLREGSAADLPRATSFA